MILRNLSRHNVILCYSVIIKKERSQKLMNFEMITEGLKQLLVKYHERNIHVPSLSVRHG